jgi:hypothetical protein
MQIHYCQSKLQQTEYRQLDFRHSDKLFSETKETKVCSKYSEGKQILCM